MCKKLWKQRNDKKQQTRTLYQSISGSGLYALVPLAGLEPAWLAPTDFKSATSTDFVTAASMILR